MKQKPTYQVGKTPQEQTAAETPRTSAPGVQHQFWGTYGYWLGDPERRYGRLQSAQNIPAHTKLEMLRDPVIAMTMGFIGATLVKAKRVIECVDEPKRRFFEAMFRRWEQEFILQAAMAVALGSCGLIKRFAFERPQPSEIEAAPVWTAAATPYIVRGFDAVYPVGTSPKFDNKGREFLGIETQDGTVDVFYSLWLTLGQARAFGAYGGSGRLENVYKHWWIKNFGWDLYLVWLQKNANPAVKVEHPPGKDSAGKSHQAIALGTGDSLRSGATVAVPSSVYKMVDQLSGDERLAAVKKWTVEFLESSSRVGQFHEMENQCDDKIALGMLLPPQAIMDVTGGDLGGPTSADKLTKLAETLLLMDAADIDRHVNDYVFPAVERANFAPGSPRVRVRTVELEQDSRTMLFEIVKVLLGKMGADTGEFDLVEALRRLDLPVVAQDGGTGEDGGVGLEAAGHTSRIISVACPLCGHDGAERYDDHGGLCVCQGCGKTFDPVAWL